MGHVFASVKLVKGQNKYIEPLKITENFDDGEGEEPELGITCKVWWFSFSYREFLYLQTYFLIENCLSFDWLMAEPPQTELYFREQQQNKISSKEISNQ